MVDIDLAKRTVSIHLSCSVCKDPELSFNAYKKNILAAYGSLTMTRPGDSEKVVLFIDRRHLDSLIGKLSEMRDAIDAVEAKAAGF